MTWLKIDDSFAEHPKVAQLSDAAFRAHVSAMCYSARLLTDGRVPEAVARSFRPKIVKELVSRGVWTTEPTTGYLIHDYLDWNPSREEVLAKRAKDSARKKGGAQTDSATTPPGLQVEVHADSSGPVPGPASPDPSTAPTANAANGKIKPTEDQLYLLKRLFDADSNWSSVTPGAIVKLNKHYGRPVVHRALQHLRESPPDHVNSSAFGLLQAACDEVVA